MKRVFCLFLLYLNNVLDVARDVTSSVFGQGFLIRNICYLPKKKTSGEYQDLTKDIDALSLQENIKAFFS